MPTHCFTQLDVWKKAHQVTLAVHTITETLPARERYHLASQM